MALQRTTKFANRSWDGTSYAIEYIGTHTDGGDDNDPRWTIRRFYRTDNGDGSYSITAIKTLTQVAWADRETLPW